MKFGAGELNQQITIERLKLSDDDSGGMREQWVFVARVWAKIKEASAREFENNSGLSSSVNYSVFIRYLDGIKSSDRIIWRGRVLNVVAPVYVGASDFLRIDCEMGVIS
jgi:SPP1 family predicted phage head-tail adaptor